METKRLYRSRGDHMLGGVAAGLAHYLNVDPVFVRLGFLALALLNGFGALLYLIMWLIIPSESSTAIDARAQVRENMADVQAAFDGLVARLRAMFQSPPS